MTKRDFTLTSDSSIYIHIIQQQLSSMGINKGDYLTVKVTSSSIKIKKKTGPTSDKVIQLLGNSLYYKLTEQDIKKLKLKKGSNIEMDVTNSEIIMNKK